MLLLLLHVEQYHIVARGISPTYIAIRGGLLIFMDFQAKSTYELIILSILFIFLLLPTLKKKLFQAKSQAEAVTKSKLS